MKLYYFQSGGVILIGGDSEDESFLSTLYRLEDAESEWKEMNQKLKHGGDLLTAFLVPDDITNCH